ncbi:MAG: hypothetical protein EPN82_10085 [Bacteroidetes bacterium]|nr:MAG: hypothetical protein EPN82_10085 [Bacteroidota bacterium]
MHQHDLNRVEFYSKEDMAGGYRLSIGEHILRNETKSVYEDINDILELYNIKQYLDNELYLKSWTENDIEDFKRKAVEYGKIVGQFMAKINDSNIISYYEQLLHEYINSFWELVNNHKIYRQISAENFENILTNNQHEIRSILTYKNLVNHYNVVLRDLFLTYPQSAEILLSIFEEKDDLNRKKERYLPQSLTIQDKEDIVSNYIDSVDSNLNYLRLIKNARNKDNFKLSDKTRLKAKRKEKQETDKIFEEKNNVYLKKYGVSISFTESQDKIKKGYIEDLVANYSYSLNYIKQNNDVHTLFLNFIILFEYLDNQNRIELVNKINQMGVIEKVMGIHSESEYRCGITFNMNEMTSHAQLVAYYKIINGIGVSLENILQVVYTSIFQERYNFANNARLSMPSANVSNFEKVRLLAPEFESVLKQFKLFVDDGAIDFELLQMSSTPCTIKDIPSLNQNKYIYFNEDNKELVGCSNLFFSDQTLLAYVEPFKEKHYNNFFELLANEKVNFMDYEEHQKPQINYLIEKGFLYLDNNDFVRITNIPRVLILKDLYENEVASFYHYQRAFQDDANQMKNQNMVFFESSLLSKPEQSYFNYYLNKSEFTNGMDLRNSYLHGTQADQEELVKHENAYFTYLKLLVLVLLKIEDDLLIYNVINKKE